MPRYELDARPVRAFLIGGYLRTDNKLNQSIASDD